jgi:hypothetical protein
MRVLPLPIRSFELAALHIKLSAYTQSILISTSMCTQAGTTLIVHLVLSCLILSYLVFSCLVMLYFVVLCFIPYHTVAHRILSVLILSYLILIAVGGQTPFLTELLHRVTGDECGVGRTVDVILTTFCHRFGRLTLTLTLLITLTITQSLTPSLTLL